MEGFLAANDKNYLRLLSNITVLYLPHHTFYVLSETTVSPSVFSSGILPGLQKGK